MTSNHQQTNLFDVSDSSQGIATAMSSAGSHGFASLEETERAAKNCFDSDMCANCHQVVFADGSPEAKLMIVGEGPGENEDLQGKPFVGRAGQLLDKILESVRLDRQRDTYICNVVKCRLPNNRAPTVDEMKWWEPYLLAQIEFVDPAIVLLMGASAVTGVLGYKAPKITKLHGTWVSSERPWLQGRQIMPFYHPAYLLRNPQRSEGSPKWQAWQAIREVKSYHDAL
jgi:DNA polymerase